MFISEKSAWSLGLGLAGRVCVPEGGAAVLYSNAMEILDAGERSEQKTSPGTVTSSAPADSQPGFTWSQLQSSPAFFFSSKTFLKRIKVKRNEEMEVMVGKMKELLGHIRASFQCL